MFLRSADSAFRRFQRTGEPAALAQVFDRTAPELLSLARHLASSEADAEDLLQATFVSAIESAGNYDAGRRVLPWLLGVLANHARAARRRARREPEAARLHAAHTPDPLAAAQATELSASVAAGIERLPEPYRPVLRLLLEHGLEPVEIARTLERPPGTVRAQISRGLDALRRALPAGLTAGAALVATPGRGLAAVRAAVLQRCGAQAGMPMAAATAGGLTLMTTKALFTVAALAAVLGYLLLSHRGQEPEAPVAPLAASPDTPAAPASEARATSEPAHDARLEVATPAPTPALTPARGARPAPRALLVRVVRALDRRPMVGTGVRLQEMDGTQDLPDQGRTTGADGAARFDDPPRGVVSVIVDRAGSLQAVVTPQAGESRVEVAVPAGILVEGLVVDPDGRPVAGAEVLAHGVLLEPGAIARSDAAGRFAIEDAQPGLALAAQWRGFLPSLACPVRGRPGDRVELTLQLGPAGRQVSGRVLRADGAPSPGALVAALDPTATRPGNDKPHPRPRFTRADRAGAFELLAPTDRTLVVIACPTVRDADAPGRTSLAAGNRAAIVDVFLRRAAVLHGTVRKGNAAVPGGAQVMLWVEQPQDDFGFLLNLIGGRVVATGPDGTYRSGGLMPGDYQLSVMSPAGAVKERRTLREGDDVRWDLDLGAGRTVRVRVEPPAPDGATGAVHWNVKLLRRLADGRSEFVSAQHVAMSDGRVDFSGLAAGEYEIVVGLNLGGTGRRDLAVAELGPIVPGAEEYVVQVREDTMPDATLRGRLVDAQLRPRPNETLHARTTGGRWPSWCTTTTGADGRFEFTPIGPGDWSVGLGEGTGATIAIAIAVAQQLRRGEARDLGDVRQP